MRLSGDRAEAPAAAAEATRAFSGPTAFPRLDLALAKGPVRGDRQSADRLPCQGALAPWAPAFRSQEAPQGPAVPAQPLLSLEPEPRHGRRRAVTRLLGRERSAPNSALPSCPTLWVTVSTPSCARGGERSVAKPQSPHLEDPVS